MKLALMSVLLLSSTLVLSACGGEGSPPGTGSAGTFTIEALGPSEALRSGASATITIKVTPQNGFQGAVTAELVTPPTGVSAMPVTTTVSGPTTLTLNVATGSAAGILKLPIKVTGGAATQTDDAFVVAYRVSTLPTGDASCVFPNCRFSAGASTISGGAYWVAGSTNTPARGSLIRVALSSGQATTFSNLVNDKYNDYAARYFGLTAAGSVLWSGFNEGQLYKARLVGLNPTTGEVLRYEVGEAGGTIINSVTLKDGRLAFLYHTPSTASASMVWSIGLFTPSTGESSLTTLADSGSFLFDLRLGPDGQLWTAQGYASPALVRFNPSTREVRRFNIGVQDSNLALGLAPTDDGKVWFLDSRARQLGILNPVDGSIRRFNGFSDLGELHPIGSDVFLVEDTSPAKSLSLLIEKPESVSALRFPTLRGVHGDLNAFAVADDGSLGYVSSGEAYVLPAN